MANHVVKMLRADFVTHNVRRLVVEKPSGYSFQSGQATDVSINKPGLENELRPFTFTALNDADHLEFIIKIYKGHNGITEKIGDLNPGDELILHDVFGTITFKGAGLFIAGGAGITPFISIFRALDKQHQVLGNTLLFANRTEEDIILKEEFQEILGGNCVNVIEKPTNAFVRSGHIDSDLLKEYVGGKTEHYYICGPDKFTTAMIENLLALGVDKSKIVFEQ